MNAPSLHMAKWGAGESYSRPSIFVLKNINGETSHRIAVIRPELVALTGNPMIAVVLNQLLYWTERLPDLTQLIEEESINITQDLNSQQFGWFHKTAEELNEETCLCISRFTLRRFLQFLVEEGWISERINPEYKWNKTTQYRVNLMRLQEDLLSLGFIFQVSHFQHLPLFKTQLKMQEKPEC